ncbi:hypothetical protein [Ralstonia pseudosolanacearum]|uniref:hypothetical protein n=1 Tax=Ralstonia pseudosolanacearum TaxID=1310165 RepID=UPI003CEA4933
MLDVGQGEGVVAGAGLGGRCAGSGIRVGSAQHDPVRGVRARVTARDDRIFRAGPWCGLRLGLRLADHQLAVVMQQRRQAPQHRPARGCGQFAQVGQHDVVALARHPHPAGLREVAVGPWPHGRHPPLDAGMLAPQAARLEAGIHLDAVAAVRAVAPRQHGQHRRIVPADLQPGGLRRWRRQLNLPQRALKAGRALHRPAVLVIAFHRRHRFPHVPVPVRPHTDPLAGAAVMQPRCADLLGRQDGIAMQTAHR